MQQDGFNVMFQLRPYQAAAAEAAKEFLRSSIDPALIDAAPAAGKSYLVAEMARWFREISGGKKVLCLQPNANLVKQNVEKFRMTGEQCSIFSASAGSKSTRHDVVYATPLTVKNSISRFLKGYCAIIIDEAHTLAPTHHFIIEAMRGANPNLRILGLTGTSYRMLKGYIFRIWPDNKTNTEEVTRDPFFTKMVYQVSAREMLSEGFITPMEIRTVNDHAIYDTSGIRLLPNGTLDHSTVEQAFEGHGRKTASVVYDVMAQVHALNVKGGVMLFAATQRHGQEILASLPANNSALSTGDHSILKGKQSTEKAIVEAYRNQEIRYLVSVAKYQVGFDVAHTEFLAFMRYSESPDLTVQTLGRAWRIHPQKPKSYIADYCGNVERHFPDGDIYSPTIEAGKAAGDGERAEVLCPDCSHTNEFKLHPDYYDYEKDVHGYCLDTFGERLESEYGPVSGHYGRRCFGMLRVGIRGEYRRCNYRWTGKDCPHCGEANDISARYCYECKGEIVDPNEKLVADFKAMKRDPTKAQTDKVVMMSAKPGVSQKGNPTLRVDWVTPYRQFSTWFQPQATHPRAYREYSEFIGVGEPETITYAKDRDSNFFRIIAYNRQADVEPELERKVA